MNVNFNPDITIEQARSLRCCHSPDFLREAFGVEDDEPVSLELIRHRAWLRGDRWGNRADLSGVDLRGADLCRTDLRWVILKGANLEDANLEGAYLRGADLREAILLGANLWGAKRDPWDRPIHGWAVNYGIMVRR